MRLLEWTRSRYGLGQLEMRAFERRAVIAPHLMRDLERLLEHLKPNLQGREWNAQAVVLAVEPRRADTKRRSPAGQDIEGGHCLDQYAWVPVGHAGNHRP